MGFQFFTLCTTASIEEKRERKEEEEEGKKDECLAHVKIKVLVTCENLTLHARLSV
jgi:hypothetical protein